jgi:hypothetical protein
MTRCILLCALVFAILIVDSSPATIVYSVAGSSHTENFDGLASTEGDILWNPNAAPGWEIYRIGGGSNPPSALTWFAASDGSANSARFYSLGTDNDRALGAVGGPTFGGAGDTISVAANQVAGWFTIGITNGTGSVLPNFTFNYDGEQWLDAGNGPDTAQTMEVQYGFGADFGSIAPASWVTPTGNFAFTSPVFSDNQHVINGNLPENRVENLGGTIGDLSWQPGTTLWLRWVERNDPGGDAALAIDHFQFSAGTADISAVPEASAFACGGVVCVVVGGIHVLRRRLGRRPNRDGDV